MLLAISIGNTNTHVGCWHGEVLIHRFTISSHIERPIADWADALSRWERSLSLPPVTGIVLASVVPVLTANVTAALITIVPGIAPVIINSRTPLGLSVHYDRPETLGSDRFINAFAAWRIFLKPDSDHTHALIVDCGTATTFSLVSAAGEFLGGSILPGIGISIDALLSRTAQLPEFDVADAPLIATNTMDALRAGVVHGFSSQIDGMIARYRAECGKNARLWIVGTGGALTIVYRHLSLIDTVRSDLPLEGLRLAYERRRSD